MGNVTNLPVGVFKWIGKTSQFNKDLIKSYNEDSDGGYFLEEDVQYPENVNDLHSNLHFFPKRMKNQKVERLVANL